MLQWALANSLATAVLAAVAALGWRSFRRYPAWGHAVWLLVLFRLLAPAWPHHWRPTLTTAPAPDTMALLLRPWLWPAPAAADAAHHATAITWLTILPLIWAIGAAAMGVAMIVRHRRVRRLGRRSLPIPRWFRQELRQLAQTLHVRRPRVYVVRGISSPFVWAMGSPSLFWPASALDAPKADRHTMLAHELTHLRRRDHHTALVIAVAQILLWWNPLLWLIRRQIRWYAETACDAEVVSRWPAQRKPYAHALITVAAASSTKLNRHALSAAGNSRRSLQRRIELIFAHSLSPRAPRIATLAASVAVLASTFVPRTASSTPLPTIVDGGTAQTTPAADPGDTAALLASFQAESWEQLRLRCEAQLEINPDDGQALSQLGIALLQLEDYEDAIDCFKQQNELGYVTTFARYNVACCYALMGETEPAIRWLEQAFESGFDNVTHIQQDPDLADIRDHSQFQEMLTRLQARLAARNS